MTTTLPPLWLPGWELDEPPAPRRYRPWVAMPDEARPATRAHGHYLTRRIRTLQPPEEYL
ncbi:hypothetical protein ABZ208_13870 [Streptomyces sp. NPDC006208]|uniref:hypothetical protein n=1 Tax=Streptomyces sp. NPDC006208 TaxID=3156734 RepID=UPI0033A27C52